MGSVWILYGVCMGSAFLIGFSWILHKLRMGSVWSLHEFSMDSVWILYEVRIDSFGTLYNWILFCMVSVRIHASKAIAESEALKQAVTRLATGSAEIPRS